MLASPWHMNSPATVTPFFAFMLALFALRHANMHKKWIVRIASKTGHHTIGENAVFGDQKPRDTKMNELKKILLNKYEVVWLIKERKAHEIKGKL